MLKNVFTICLIISSHWLVAQSEENTLTLEINVIFNGSQIELSDDLAEGNLSSIETFKCYLSNFKLLKDGREIWKEENSFHLVDAEDSGSMKLSLGLEKEIEFDQIEFTLGIDSTTSVSGVFGGDLDPTNGMYWTWNSGYVNFKLEGQSKISEERVRSFKYHIGGYLPPFATCQKVLLNCQNENELELEIDLDAFLNGIDIADQSMVMSAGNEAFIMSQQASKIFSVNNEK